MLYFTIKLLYKMFKFTLNARICFWEKVIIYMHLYSISGLIFNRGNGGNGASVAPGLCLGALSKVPTEIYKFLIEVPFAKEKSPCPFKYEVSGLQFTPQWRCGDHIA